MLEARKKKKQSESLFCKNNFSSLEFLLYLWRREHLTQEEVFDIGPCFQSTAGSWHLSPSWDSSAQLCLAQQHQRSGLVELLRVEHRLGVLPVTPAASSRVVSPGTILFLLHLSLVSLQIPLRQVMMRMMMMSQKIQVICFSGISFEEALAPEQCSSSGCWHSHSSSLFVLKSEMEPWGNLAKNLETAARVVLLLCSEAAQQQHCVLETWCWESE